MLTLYPKKLSSYVIIITRNALKVCYYIKVGTNNYILCVNAGSSSLKLTAVPFEADTTTKHPSYHADMITDYELALHELLSNLQSDHPIIYASIAAVGHRIVHGGPQGNPARIVTDELITEIESYAAFAPQHMPAALSIMKLLRRQLTHVPHVACFDTAFFHDIPAVARTIALPHKLTDLGVRRYGFHGLSYEYLLKKLVAKHPSALTEKIIVAHLGSGASIAAIHKARAVDTTMGFTPSSGLVMSSRLGETDPALPVFLHKEAGISFADWARIINKESGLVGVSGVSGDMHELLDMERRHPDAKRAVELFVYRAQKAIGELSAAMGGVDRIVFSGGIGEKSAILRRRIMANFGYLGFRIDPTHNNVVTEPTSIHNIYSQDSKPIHVIHTDESESIAAHVRNTANLSTKKEK